MRSTCCLSLGSQQQQQRQQQQQQQPPTLVAQRKRMGWASRALTPAPTRPSDALNGDWHYSTDLIAKINES